MTHGQVKRWLYRARNIQGEVRQLEEKKRQTRERLTNMTQTFSGMPSGGSHDPHKFDAILELDSMISSRLNILSAIEAEELNIINTLPDSRHRSILIGFYLNGKKMETVAEENCYALQHAYRLKREAEKALQDVIKC